MLAFTFIIAIAALILAVGTLILLINSKGQHERAATKLSSRLDINRAAIKALNRSFTSRVEESINHLVVKEGNSVHGVLKMITDLDDVCTTMQRELFELSHPITENCNFVEDGERVKVVKTADGNFRIRKDSGSYDLSKDEFYDAWWCGKFDKA